MARRYRVAYTVTKGPPYEVMHSNAVFFFDRDGRARLVTTDTSDTTRDGGGCEAVAGITPVVIPGEPRDLVPLIAALSPG